MPYRNCRIYICQDRTPSLRNSTGSASFGNFQQRNGILESYSGIRHRTSNIWCRNSLRLHNRNLWTPNMRLDADKV